MNEITLDHIREAALWAAAEHQGPLAGVQRVYNQTCWDCGTACCIWGAANLLAGNGPVCGGPSWEWAKMSPKRTLIARLLASGYTTPEQILRYLDEDVVCGI